MATGVIVNTRTAPGTKGSPAGTDNWFVAAQGGSKTVPVAVRTMAEFEAAFGARAGGLVPLWDAVDVYFRTGGKRVVIGSYGSSQTYADGLTLLNDRKLGPGQLSVIGTTPSQQVYADLAAAAQANNRVVIADVTNGATVTEAEALGDSLPVGAAAEYVGVFGSWVNVPGPAGVLNASARTVPASPIIAALCARVDADGNPNRAAAGRDYFLTYVNGLVSDPSDSDRESLLTHKVNSFTDSWGIFVNYNFRSGVAKDPNTPFWELNCTRARMWLKWQAELRGENYYQRPLDARGHLAGALKKDLVDMALDLYNVDGLYGDTPQEAFDVNVDSAVNNTSTAADAQLAAIMEARLSLAAETVAIDLVSVPVQGQIS